MEEIRAMLEVIRGDLEYYMDECDSHADEYTNDDIAYLRIGINARIDDLQEVFDKLGKLYVEDEDDLEC